MIRPVLDYGDIVYGNASKTELIKIDRFRKGYKNVITTNNTLTINLNWLGLKTRRKYHTIVEVKRCLNGHAPELCQHYFNRINHNYYTRGNTKDIRFPKLDLK